MSDDTQYTYDGKRWIEDTDLLKRIERLEKMVLALIKLNQNPYVVDVDGMLRCKHCGMVTEPPPHFGHAEDCPAGILEALAGEIESIEAGDE